MQPLLIFPGEQCYDAKGFHCRRDEDGHNLHCTECHQYAADRMTRETITVYRYPRTAPEPEDVSMCRVVETRECPPSGSCPGVCVRFPLTESPEIQARRADPDDLLCSRPGCTVESSDAWHACVMGPAGTAG